MQDVAPGRVGLQGTISGFVVAEDMSAIARLKRACLQAKMQIAVGMSRLHARGAQGDAWQEFFARKQEFFARNKTVVSQGLARLRESLERRVWRSGAPAAATLATFTPAAVISAAHHPVPSGAQHGPLWLRGITVYGGLILHALRLPARMRNSAHERALPQHWKRWRLHLALATVIAGLGVAYLGVVGDGEPASAGDVPEISTPHAGAPLLAPAAVVAAPDNPAPSRAGEVAGAADLRATPAEPVRLSIDEQPWVPVKRPIAMLNLEAPDVDGADLALEVAQRGGSARRERFLWQPRNKDAGGSTRPLIQLSAERYVAEQPLIRAFFPDMASRAAEMQISIERMAPQGIVASKFGDLEIADSTLRIDEKFHACLMFRRADSLGFVLSGWYCGAPGKAVDRVALRCFIDRLDIVGAGQDKALKRFFAEAERKRKSCPSARSSGKKLTWLDHEAPLPTLKADARPPRR